jgi:acetyltransferase
MPSSGRVAFISQSGALGTAMLDWSIENGVGFSYFISIGSMIDVDFNDLIEYLGNDPNTSGIILYMESLADSQRFVNVCKEVVKKKPILTLKVGKTAEGANAAKSHTGSIAGNDAIFDVAFKAAGIVRLTTIEEMLNCFEFLSMHDSPKGENIAILTNAGGPGVVATDMLVSQNGKLAKLSASTIEELNKVLPAFWSHGNPIDVLGDAPPERYKQALDIIVKDANIDSILVIVTPQAMTNPEGVARELVSAYKADKTVVASFIGGHDVSKAKPVLEKGKIPFYETPEEALDCLISLSEYQKKKSINVIPDKPFNFKADKKKAESLIQFAVSEGRKSLSEDEAKKVLSCYGIDSPKVEIAKKKSDISKIVSKLDFPIVMKILSPDILHKTDIGGVVLNINSKKEAEAAFDNILKSVKKKMPAARIDGILVEEMIKRNYELLFGSKKDPLFGRVIVFGMGGTAVELYKDTAIELPPITMQKAKTMIDSTKIGKLMSGYRGMKSADINLIQQLFCQFAKLLEDFPQIKEIDINPLAIAVDKTTKAAVLDAKILLE